jgi:o-succinylbenzoate synthase
VNLFALDKAELVAIGGRLPAPTGNARAVWNARTGVALRLEAEGLVGWGECCPLPGVSPDTLDDSAAVLARLLGADLPRVDLDDPYREIALWRERIPRGNPAARFAFETAIFDLCAQAYGSTVASLIGESRTPCPASALVDLEAWQAQAADAVAAGIGTIKVKIGRPGLLERELGELAALRAAHPHLRLRIDANGALGDDAPRAIGALADLSPEWIEQPVAPGRLAALGPQACLIAADESVVVDDDDLWLAVHSGVVSVLVAKPALIGGLVATAELDDRARSLDVEVVVSHLLDGPVALAACAELAVALGNPRAAGLGRHPGLEAFDPIAVPQLYLPHLVSSFGPGLGVPLE